MCAGRGEPGYCFTPVLGASAGHHQWLQVHPLHFFAGVFFFFFFFLLLILVCVDLQWKKSLDFAAILREIGFLLPETWACSPLEGELDTLRVNLCVCPHLLVQDDTSFYLEHGFCPTVCVCVCVWDYLDPSAYLVTWQSLVPVNHLQWPTVKYLRVFTVVLCNHDWGTEEHGDPFKQLPASGLLVSVLAYNKTAAA